MPCSGGAFQAYFYSVGVVTFGFAVAGVTPAAVIAFGVLVCLGVVAVARSGATLEFYKANDASRLAGCGWLLAGPVVSQLVLALPSDGGRTVRDRITGTVVIVNR